MRHQTATTPCAPPVSNTQTQPQRLYYPTPQQQTRTVPSFGHQASWPQGDTERNVFTSAVAQSLQLN